MIDDSRVAELAVGLAAELDDLAAGGGHAIRLTQAGTHARNSESADILRRTMTH
jgi:hypothetical protein